MTAAAPHGEVHGEAHAESATAPDHGEHAPAAHGAEPAHPSSSPAGHGAPADAHTTKLPSTTTTHGAAANHGGEPAWSYTGNTDPEHWASLKTEWSVCATGREQSPVDIPRSAADSRNGVKLNYGSVQGKVIDNGHTIQVNVASGPKAVINQRTYDLKQFHFHTPSEHQLAGVSYPLEVHFVHKDSDGKLAVIGAFIESGADAKEMRKVIASIPQRQGVEQDIPAKLDLAQMLPRNLAAYQYPGSLTTPPCTEGVIWSVLKQPITLSAEQIKELRSHYSQTNRPVQPLGSRRFGAPAALAH